MRTDAQVSVLLISDVDEGGAAIACQRVYLELNRRMGDRCKWAVASGIRHAGVVNGGKWPSFPALVTYEVRRRVFKNERAVARAEHSFNAVNIGKIVHRLNPKLIYLYNIHQRMAFDLVNVFPKDSAIVISLQDMWYLTGYCCYSMGCEKYRTGCKGICPQWKKWEIPTRAADEEWRRRQAYYLENAHRIYVTAPSKWMAKCAEDRFKGAIRVEHIPNAVDTSVFRPLGAKREIRQLLGFEPDRPLVLCGAVRMDDERKGARYLREALARLKQRFGAAFTVAVFGASADGGAIPDAVGLGAIREERLLNLYYNAATVFVLPSLAESFGLVFAEAMAAGTPCVAFDTTACSELVRKGETGYLAELSDADSLAAALVRALEAGDNNPLSHSCREHAVAEYDVRVVGEQHLRVIEHALGERN